MTAVTASAQSSVTMYGVLDTGLTYTTHTTGNKTAWGMNTGNRASTRWGLKGREELGDGLAAIFQLEDGFNPNTGAIMTSQAGRLFGRYAFVGLDSANYGQLLMGRNITVQYRYGLSLDPLDYSSYGLAAQDSEFAGRADNSVVYNLKKGPFEVNTLYSFGYEGVNAAPVPGNYRVDKEVNVGGRYVDGPVNISFLFEQRQGTATTTGNQDERHYVLGGTYALNAKTTLYGGYDLIINNIATTLTTQPSRYMVYGGARYFITPEIDIAAATYYHSYHNVSGHALSTGVQADYFLSKRTSLYFNGTYVVNTAKTQLSALGSTIPATMGQNQLGISIGIVHKF